MEIKIERTDAPKPKPDQKALGFGKYLSDHMFLMDYDGDRGWHDARIVPYGPIPLEPDAVALHYAQETFEGLKAYRYADGSVHLFRPEKNAQRLINSNRRLCMPEIPVEDFVEAVKALVRVDADWVPSEPDTSLYIRPFMFTSEGQIALHNCSKFVFAIITSPVGAYFAEGINPVKILVEDEYVRAVRGGTGFAKCGGNCEHADGNGDFRTDKKPEDHLIGRCEVRDLLSIRKIRNKRDETEHQQGQNNQRYPEELLLIHTRLSFYDLPIERLRTGKSFTER